MMHHLFLEPNNMDSELRLDENSVLNQPNENDLNQRLNDERTKQVRTIGMIIMRVAITLKSYFDEDDEHFIYAPCQNFTIQVS